MSRSKSSTTTTILNVRMSITSDEEKIDLMDESAELMVTSTSSNTTSTGVTYRPATAATELQPPAAVRFGSVSIREYPVIVGDNPGGISGPPLSIDWGHHGEMTVDLISYEEQRPPRRQGREMLVPVDVRVERLRNAGYSRAEIVNLTKPVNIARSQRRRTLDTLHLQPLQQLQEKFSRKTRSLLTGGRRKKMEKALLECPRPEASPIQSTVSTRSSFQSEEDNQSSDPTLESLHSFDNISPVGSEDTELTA